MRKGRIMRKRKTWSIITNLRPEKSWENSRRVVERARTRVRESVRVWVSGWVRWCKELVLCLITISISFSNKWRNSVRWFSYSPTSLFKSFYIVEVMRFYMLWDKWTYAQMWWYAVIGEKRECWLSCMKERRVILLNHKNLAILNANTWYIAYLCWGGFLWAYVNMLWSVVDGGQKWLSKRYEHWSHIF